MKNIWKNYKKDTPALWRKIGDSILLFTLALDGMITQLPISDNSKIWVGVIVTFLGIAGNPPPHFSAPKNDSTSDKSA